MKLALLISAAISTTVGITIAGPYSLGLNDPTNPNDAPVPGFLGPHGEGKARLYTGELDENWDPVFENPANYVNPLFFGWADSVVDYTSSDFVAADQSDPNWALGPVTGDHFFDVVSLGDLNETTILTKPPGSITLALAEPVSNLTGADFVVFENAYIQSFQIEGSTVGGVFAELGYVEVSANGTDFIRFPSTSLGTDPRHIYEALDPSGIHNLAGKHVNAYGDSWGTPFDLDDVSLSQITHIRIIDVPGDGSFLDHFNNPIYDSWYPFGGGTASGTSGTGGFDLEAIGAISVPMTFASWPQLEALDATDRDPNDDPDGEGLSNLLEYAFASLPWKADTTNLPTCSISGTEGEFRFIRDERLTDLTYDVQVSATLESQSWVTIARSVAGAPVTATPGHSPSITENSNSQITGIGVVREVIVREPLPTGGGKRFYRVLVSSPSP